MVDMTTRGFRTSLTLDEEHYITCPAFAESITEGDLRWEKGKGDSISVDEVICEVETDKTSVLVPSPVSGVIEELLVEDVPARHRLHLGAIAENVKATHTHSGTELADAM